MIEELDNDIEKAQYLQNLIISHATGGSESNADYQSLRKWFVGNTATKSLLPNFVRTNRDLAQFWQYIKFEYSTYAERRNFIYSEFVPLFDFLEGRESAPSDSSISEGLKSFDEDGVHAVWARALERRKSDSEGAITSARTLLETVCKHILDKSNVSYNEKNIELSELYKLTAKELNLSPSQHTEDLFKQILGGCSAVVNGLGVLRNRLGDAHGHGKKPVKPAARHAELAVNLSGSLALFLIATFEHQSGTGT